MTSGLWTLGALLTAARRDGYAIPAFNVDSFDMLLAVVNAACATDSPVIIQLTQPAAQFLGIRNAVAVAREEVARTGIPIALHLDHATTLPLIEECLAAGFTSVMIDGSTLEWSANVETTRRVRAIARHYGASVESEVGHVGTSARGPAVEVESGASVEHDRTVLTEPEEVARFVEETGVDALAVSVGSSHGLTTRSRVLDFDRLAAIMARVTVPLVLHGSSGVREHDVAQVARYGVAKVNVETELRVAFRGALERELSADPTNIKPRLLMGAVRTAVQQKCEMQLTLLGCAGRARAFQRAPESHHPVSRTVTSA